MTSRGDVLLNVSQVIAYLVTAVRRGDARGIEELLGRFSLLAEIEDLMALRAALDDGLHRAGPAPVQDSGHSGVCVRAGLADSTYLSKGRCPSADVAPRLSLVYSTPGRAEASAAAHQPLRAGVAQEVAASLAHLLDAAT
ncbi:hypothetical protein [Streptacidiphilus sp. EB129]|jgi:hypothetical protein|uniref:hypothetical protein n=1 Tax=Streptacidiphilus sp. EB129 TaxID=3156262 RepID=UPI0035173663